MILCLYDAIIGGAVHVHNMFQPLQNKVQSLRKAQNLLPKFAPVLTRRYKQKRPTSPWRCLRKYLANHCPIEPLLCPGCWGQAWKQPQKECPCYATLGGGLSWHGWALTTCCRKWWSHRKKYFHTFIFYFIILFTAHDGWIQQERQSSLETYLSAGK